MRKYKGYYIDGVVFKNNEEVDAFIKKSIIEKIKAFHEMLFSGRYEYADMMAISNEIATREQRLHDEYGMDWETIENIPFEEV